MSCSSRDRISVDLGGLRAALFEQARAHGVRPSDFVRASLARSLGIHEPVAPLDLPSRSSISDRVRLTLRMARADAHSTVRAARIAGLSPGEYVAGLVAGIVPSATGAERTGHISALTASSAELSTLSRNIHHLTALLRQGSVRAAQEYREMLDSIAGDIRRHLLLAGGVLSDLAAHRRQKGRRANDAKAI